MSALGITNDAANKVSEEAILAAVGGHDDSDSGSMVHAQGANDEVESGKLSDIENQSSEFHSHSRQPTYFGNLLPLISKDCVELHQLREGDHARDENNSITLGAK